VSGVIRAGGFEDDPALIDKSKGFGVRGSGFGVMGSRLGVQGPESRVQGSGLSGWALGPTLVDSKPILRPSAFLDLEEPFGSSSSTV
jgi:hypothetical protein